MKNEENIKKQKIISLSLVVFGTVGFLLASIFPSSISALDLYIVTTYLAVPTGLGWYAHTKGRSIAWGLMGFLIVIGPLVALLALQASPNSLRYRIMRAVVLIGFIGLIVAIAIPQYTKYMMRKKTQDAMINVKSIHLALVDWQADPEQGDGVLPPEVIGPGKAGAAFTQQYPETTELLTSGDGNYIYWFEPRADENGLTVPIVTAVARNGYKVYGERLVSNSDGSVRVERGEDSGGSPHTSLMRAASFGDNERVKLLLAKGIDPNIQTPDDGWTALMSAAEGGRTETVRVLLDYGANVDDKNKYGDTPLWVAKGWGHTDVVKTLKEAGAKE